MRGVNTPLSLFFAECLEAEYRGYWADTLEAGKYGNCTNPWRLSALGEIDPASERPCDRKSRDYQRGKILDHEFMEKIRNGSTSCASM